MSDLPTVTERNHRSAAVFTRGDIPIRGTGSNGAESAVGQGGLRKGLSWPGRGVVMVWRSYRP